MIRQVKTPIPGSMVSCPADRGDPAFMGRVLDVGQQVYQNCKGSPFVWVVVRNPRGNKAIWPSNRLGLCN